MDFSHISPGLLFSALYHLANGLALLSLLMRDQFHLRLVFAVSLILQGLYYAAIPGGPLFDPLFWKVFSSITNFAMIGILFHDRIDFGIKDNLRDLRDRIKVLSPGQFRRLTATAKHVHGPLESILVQNEIPDTVYYIIKGHASVHKDGGTIRLSHGSFLGEIAFLTGGAATATVSLDADAECVCWTHADLHALAEKDVAIDIALRGLFNHDLAHKVSRSALSSIPAAKPQPVPAQA
jgi:CRP-like cAMP-binding protein